MALESARYSDNVYTTVVLTGAQTSQRLNLTGFGPAGARFQIPANYQIDGVLVEVEAKQSTTSRDLAARLIIGGTVDGTNVRTATITTTEQFYSFGGATDTWGRSDLTPALLNATPDFGVSLRIETAGVADTTSIDAVRVTVYASVPVAAIVEDDGMYWASLHAAFAATQEAYESASAKVAQLAAAESEYVVVKPVAVAATVAGVAVLTSTLTAAGALFDVWHETAISWQIPPPAYPSFESLAAAAQGEDIPVGTVAATATVLGAATVTATLSAAGVNLDVSAETAFVADLAPPSDAYTPELAQLYIAPGAVALAATVTGSATVTATLAASSVLLPESEIVGLDLAQPSDPLTPALSANELPISALALAATLAGAATVTGTLTAAGTLPDPAIDGLEWWAPDLAADTAIQAAAEGEVIPVSGAVEGEAAASPGEDDSALAALLASEWPASPQDAPELAIGAVAASATASAVTTVTATLTASAAVPGGSDELARELLPPTDSLTPALAELLLPIAPVAVTATAAGVATVTAVLTASSVIPEQDGGDAPAALVQPLTSDAELAIGAIAASATSAGTAVVSATLAAAGALPDPSTDAFEWWPPESSGATAIAAAAEGEVIPVSGTVEAAVEPVLEDDSAAIALTIRAPGVPLALWVAIADTEVIPVPGVVEVEAAVEPEVGWAEWPLRRWRPPLRRYSERIEAVPEPVYGEFAATVEATLRQASVAEPVEAILLTQWWASVRHATGITVEEGPALVAGGVLVNLPAMLADAAEREELELLGII